MWKEGRTHLTHERGRQAAMTCSGQQQDNRAACMVMMIADGHFHSHIPTDHYNTIKDDNHALRVSLKLY